MKLSEEERELINLYSCLTHLGNIYPLDIFFDSSTFISELNHFPHPWKQYNPRKPHIPRYGISLTSADGTLNGIPDLDSLREYNKENGTTWTESKITIHTHALEHFNSIQSPIQNFLPHLGRSHLRAGD